MSRKKQPNAHHDDAPTPRDLSRRSRSIYLLMAALVLITIAAIYLSRSRNPGPTTASGTAEETPPAKSTALPADPTAADSAAAATAAKPRPAEFASLKGRWLRPDGEYVIAIEDVALDGTVKAAYYNPTAIHVSEARASKEGDRLELYVELRDVNYPGCTYRLNFVPETDQLQGVYYQAAMREEYEVAFVRLP